MFAVLLEELTVDNVDNPQTIVHAWDLGGKDAPAVYFTTGTDLIGQRFGDPHAIHYSLGEKKENIQVAGFLAITNLRSPLLSLTDRWILPEKYR